MVTSCSAFGNGSGRNKTESITAKMARFAPRQIAIVASAVTVNAGDLRSWRRANFRSFMSLVTQRDHRVDRHCAARWEIGGDQCRAAQKDGDDGVNRKIVCADTVKQAR